MRMTSLKTQLKNGSNDRKHGTGTNNDENILSCSSSDVEELGCQVLFKYFYLCYFPMSFACFSACFSFSAALFSSLAFPPFGLFFSALLLGLATNSPFLGGMSKKINGREETKRNTNCSRGEGKI